MATAIPFIALGSQLAGQAVGYRQQSRQNRQAAGQARDAATIQAQAQWEQDQRTMANARAEAGATGVGPAGSVLDVMRENLRKAEQNRLRILQAGGLNDQQIRQLGVDPGWSPVSESFYRALHGSGTDLG